MSISSSAKSTAAEIARAAFDFALAQVASRARSEIPAYVTREDFEQAIIALRYDAMSLQEAQLDAQVENDHREEQEAHDRGVAMSEGMDITVVDPEE